VAEFRMPALGADMDEGTVLEWLVKPGDEVRKGDAIAVIDTAKSAIDAESFCTGTVGQLIIGVGQTVPIGTVLATITEPGEGETAPGVPAVMPAERKEPKRPQRQAAPRKRAPKRGAASENQPAAPVSPLIRRRARELGVDLAKLHGSGREGSVTRADVERAAADQQAISQPVVAQPPARPPKGQLPPDRAASRRPVTPRARRIAAELGVDLPGVTGTGPDGSVREADVRRSAAAGQAGQLPPAAAAEPIARSAAERTQSMRQAIARLMARSKREIPHYYVSNTVDMTSALSWLRERNRELDVSERLVPAALLLKAAALAARRVPGLNGYWVDDQFSPAGPVHLGLAISLRGGGLLTPAIHNAADLRLDELMTQMRDLVSRARTGRLRSSELTDATITVTNLGDQGVESVFGIIYPPQVALVGFGKIIERPFAAGGLIGARPAVVTTLAADHRATDGYTGARYLTAVSDLLQRPEEL
jgi:pyruvate dehydrogenase E2 component (dihydrolipoamide acetyltransferase)